MINNINSFDFSGAERDFSCYLPLHRAILQGNWSNAREFFEKSPAAVTARITALAETPLLVAVKGRQRFSFIRELVNLMPSEALSLSDYFGNTVLHAVAVLGDIRAAKMFVHRNRDLPNTWNNDGSLPLHLAAMRGEREMALYLFSVTEDDEKSRTYESEAGATLMRFAINVGFYDLALHLLQVNPKLAWEDFSPLEEMAQEPSNFPSGTCFNILQSSLYSCVPSKLLSIRGLPSHVDVVATLGQGKVPRRRRCWAQFVEVLQTIHVLLWRVLETLVRPVKNITQIKLMHHLAIHLVERLCKEVIALDNTNASPLLKPPFLFAAQYGIHEIIKEILDSYPNAITFIDEENRTALHLAVMYRRDKVFKILYQRSGQYKLLLPLLLDNRKNNILHLVGYRAFQNQLDLSYGAVLQMQRELQWFKEIEKFVLPQERKSVNSEGKTPLLIFQEEHKDLIAREGQWMIGMATSCTVAASLIATVAFAAAITVPGGNNSQGLPIFSKEKGFLVFAISDGLSLLSAVCTVLAFLSIFTSRYAAIDFLYALPKRLIIGLLALFLSVTALMVAFSSTLYLVLAHKHGLILIPVVILACLPVTMFATLQLPPLLNMIRSTYGPSIFT